MAKRLLAAVAAMALIGVLVIPATASAMPPKEPALMKALKARGVVPGNAPAATQQLAYKLYLSRRLAAGDGDRGNPIANRAMSEQGGTMRGAGGHGKRKNGSMATDNVLVLLVEFNGSETAADNTVFTGPLHNELPKPVAGDNTTFWIDDFSANYYSKMLFDQSFGAKSFSNYFREQSGGSYMPVGQVTTAWVKVPHSEWYYGANDPDGSGDDLNGPVWRVVRDAVANAQGIDWAKYDTEDPYDIDGDGNTAEPDGYVDHLMVIHAGAGEEAGGGAQGESAIWSHSWFADYGTGGPGYGGVPTNNPKVWVGAYTIEPEDGTVGVFTHEFSHDLGLPDQYDTDYSGESSTGFWTLMSSGSWLGTPGTPLGTSPSALNAWEKWALGWSKPVIVTKGQAKSVKVRDSSQFGNTNKAVRVSLPDKSYTVHVTDPRDGTGSFWYSGSGDDLDNTLVRTVDVPSVDPTLRFWTWYQIEAGYDYGYVQVSTAANPGPSDWVTIPSSLSTEANGGIDGSSNGWVQASYDLSAYAGQSVKLRLRYLTDGGVALKGWAVDDITLGSFTDDGSATGWTANGWTNTSGTDTKTAVHYYIAEWRQPTGFDVSMNAWYNFYDDSATAQFFKGSPGMLVWYRDTQYTDNIMANHPWAGQLLLVDANPGLVTQASPAGAGFPTATVPFRTRVQLMDATFGLKPSISNPITRWGVTTTFASKPAVATFDDTKSWADKTFAPYLGDSVVYTNAIDSVSTPGYGVKMTVKAATPAEANVLVDFSKPRK